VRNRECGLYIREGGLHKEMVIKIVVAGMKIVDHQTRRSLGPNESGELLVKSASLMSGYWQDPSATVSSLDEDCWFQTGQCWFRTEKVRWQ
jgi:long-subunit acyl-CoA synthetase (AMP-forming)